jgi:hypothetical protein
MDASIRVIVVPLPVVQAAMKELATIGEKRATARHESEWMSRMRKAYARSTERRSE